MKAIKRIGKAWMAVLFLVTPAAAAGLVTITGAQLEGMMTDGQSMLGAGGNMMSGGQGMMGGGATTPQP